MVQTSFIPGRQGLEQHGIVNAGIIYWNLPTPALYEEAARRRKGLITHFGPLVVRTGQHIGRSPNDKFIVREPSSEAHTWWGKVNQPFSPDRFEALYARVLAYLQGCDLFVQDCYVGADPTYRLSIWVITETAWHNPFARNLFIRLSREELATFTPDFTIIDLPNFHAAAASSGQPALPRRINWVTRFRRFPGMPKAIPSSPRCRVAPLSFRTSYPAPKDLLSLP
ncbi:MAG: phosphoenolpyruvate carboxykinase (ATP) [Ardenticatenaceae bacterium]|nr:phosphoenolpyruvate carboxykinase (ATP) [Ardenticatenaceae bacterium]